MVLFFSGVQVDTTTGATENKQRKWHYMPVSTCIASCLFCCYFFLFFHSIVSLNALQVTDNRYIKRLERREAGERESFHLDGIIFWVFGCFLSGNS